MNARPLFDKIKYALHLPQYLSYLITHIPCSDITSIGCHTNLWNFTENNYHEWVAKEAIDKKLAPILPANEVLPVQWEGRSYSVGIGLHDSSAALIPYLVNFHEPFILISTGTWCISLNPFNNEPLTTEELQNDCLCYLTFEGKPVKASRLFAGNEHEQQVQSIANHFNQDASQYQKVDFDPGIITSLQNRFPKNDDDKIDLKASAFVGRSLADFKTGEEAYHPAHS
jgi:sugar (pentulose or hexulose) kinase